jgi:hypothetical protein
MRRTSGMDGLDTGRGVEAIALQGYPSRYNVIWSRSIAWVSCGYRIRSPAALKAGMVSRGCDHHVLHGSSLPGEAAGHVPVELVRRADI